MDLVKPKIEPSDAPAPPLADEPMALTPDEALDLPSARRTISAEEARERLARGETLRDACVERLVFTGEITHPVRMSNVVLLKPVFEKAKFRDEVALRHCTLDRPRFPKWAEFDRGFNLTGSTVLHAVVRKLTVRGAFCADYLRTRGKFLVADSKFEGPVRFWEARLGGWVDFKNCHFEAEADFRSLHAEEGFVLTRCQFVSDFLFRGATVCKKFDATDSRFEASLDLSKAKLHDFVYLESIAQGERQRFAFQNALAERVLVRTEQLVGRLASEEAGDHVRAMQEYGLLKRSFEALHRYEQEDWAFYRFKINQRRSRPRSWSRPWTKLTQLLDWLLLDLGCGYGTHPLRAVRASGIIILFFGLTYMADVSALPVEKWPFPNAGASHYFPNRLLVGFLTSVSVFTTGFGNLRDMASGWLNIPLIIESLLGTFLWGLFIVAFSRKVIR
jgi:hypothetical protein